MANECEMCKGCEFVEPDVPGAWCYMFRNKPRHRECAQHTKFKQLREALLPVTEALLAIGAVGCLPSVDMLEDEW